jgi:endonuclease YncB( thermonuclease family)
LSNSDLATTAQVTYTAKVVGVSDGDTITVLRDKTQVRIRLHGIDTPEKAQPFGQKAKQCTAELVFGKHVQVEVVTQDRYGRTVAKVSYPSKMHRNPLDRSKTHQAETVYRSLQESLVQAGLAWWYQRYAPNDTHLAELEREAWQAKRGLWADAHPVPPWDWRRGKRARARAASVQRRVPEQGSSRTGSGELRCNVKSKVCHQPGCRHYRCKNCTATFSSEAEAAGGWVSVASAAVGALRRRGARVVAGQYAPNPPPNGAK